MMLIGTAIVLAVIIAIVVFVFTSGNESGSTDNNKSTPKFTTQYDDVKDGATVAEIVIKDFGTVKIQLFESKAPKACENFITHAKDGYYNGLTFHRVISDFMIQGETHQEQVQAVKVFGVRHLKMKLQRI